MLMIVCISIRALHKRQVLRLLEGQFGECFVLRVDSVEFVEHTLQTYLASTG